MRIGKFICTLACVLTFASAGFADIYDAPAGYYNSAAGLEGAALKTELASIMTVPHIQRTYGAFRFASVLFDTDPNNSSNIILVYNEASVSGTWDSGSTWNREHVWPQSLQPGSASNSSTGNLGDHHALKPSNPGINSSRGNKPFGNFNSSGVFGAQVGGTYYPGDNDAGDISRALFYSDTRYDATLTDLSTGILGDLTTLILWNYADPPDDFERRRNQVIFSQAENPSSYQNNRNAFIDRPETVWSIYGGGNNDSQLFVGGGAAADGSSSTTVDLGRVITGSAVPGDQSVLLTKDFADPTYYAVTAAGDATSDVNDRFNAFVFGPQNANLNVGLNASTATAGLRTGTVTIDNIDVSTGGAGLGSADGDDVITVNLDVLDPSNASFASGVDQNLLTIDFGTFAVGGTVNSGFDLFNLVQSVGFTADLDLDSIPGVGDTGVLSTDLSAFGGLVAGSSNGFLASFDTSNVGTFSATYTLNLSDEDIAGATNQVLTLQLLGEVAGLLDGDLNGDGFVGVDDLNIVLINWNQNVTPGDLGAGDATGEGFVGVDDLNIVLVNWNNGTPPADGGAIPEPGTLALLGLGAVAGLRRTGRKGA
jgi:endonuclease I